MSAPRTASEMLKLEDAVRYPGAWKKVALIVLAGLAVMIASTFVIDNVWVSVGLFMLCWMGGTAFVIRRANRLMALAARIFKDHPEYTPQQASNVARRELGLREVQYP